MLRTFVLYHFITPWMYLFQRKRRIDKINCLKQILKHVLWYWNPIYKQKMRKIKCRHDANMSSNFCVTVYLTICVSVCVSVCLSDCLTDCICVCLSVRLSYTVSKRIEFKIQNKHLHWYGEPRRWQRRENVKLVLNQFWLTQPCVDWRCMHYNMKVFGNNYRI